MQFDAPKRAQSCLISYAKQHINLLEHHLEQNTRVNTHWYTESRPDLRMDFQMFVTNDMIHVLLGSTWVNVNQNDVYRKPQSQAHIINASYQLAKDMSNVCGARLVLVDCAQFSATRLDMCQRVLDHPMRNKALEPLTLDTNP